MSCLKRLTLFENQEDDHNIVDLRLKIIILGLVPWKMVKFNLGLTATGMNVHMPQKNLTSSCIVTIALT